MSRVIAITGAFGVLGKAVARKASQKGYRIGLIDFAPLQSGHVDNNSYDCFAQGSVDLTNGQAAEAAVSAIAKKFGKIDAVVNVAGGFVWQTTASPPSPTEHVGTTWERMFAMNVKTALNTSVAAIPHLKLNGSGRIVNVGANGALKAAFGMGAYAASKEGVHKLTQSLAEELKESNITVNAVLPGIIDTPTNRRDMPAANFSAWVNPDDLAEVILFLASPEASAVTGALLPVTGKN